MKFLDRVIGERLMLINNAAVADLNALDECFESWNCSSFYVFLQFTCRIPFLSHSF